MTIKQPLNVDIITKDGQFNQQWPRYFEDLATRRWREVLTANRTYYVRTDGSDSNTGRVDSAAGAFLTLQQALDTVAALDLKTYAVTIDMGDGTYTDSTNITKAWVGGSGVTIQGNSGTPANVLLSTAGNLLTFSVPLASPVTVKDIEVRTSSGDAFRITASVTFNYSNIVFGAIANAGIHALYPGAYIQCNGNYTINGNAARHWNFEYPCNLRCTSKTITLTGTPDFSQEFAQATFCGGMSIGGNTYSGSATGKLYDVTMNGWINSGVTLPGDSAGSTATGGQYV
ncbi:MAG: hypothetical protein GY807_21070 [Gammaproteobacteria bacterium]|nr:hypothetical protein [Gammaproteobacteria bacterium]